MSDDDLIRRGDAIAAAANLYKWSIAAGEELEAVIRAIPAALAPTDAPDTDLLFDAYKGLLVLHRTLDRIGLALGTATASRIADKIVAAHPEFPARTALRHTEEPK